MSHGQAGLGTDFGNMTNIRLAPEGVYATVLPMTAAHASTWKNWRQELEKDYRDILVIANTAANQFTEHERRHKHGRNTGSRQQKENAPNQLGPHKTIISQPTNGTEIHGRGLRTGAGDS